jgi:hypothetical protein
MHDQIISDEENRAMTICISASALTGIRNKFLKQYATPRHAVSTRSRSIDKLSFVYPATHFPYVTPQSTTAFAVRKFMRNSENG